MLEKWGEKVNVQRNTKHKRKYAVIYKLHSVQQKFGERRFGYLDYENIYDKKIGISFQF